MIAQDIMNEFESEDEFTLNHRSMKAEPSFRGRFRTGDPLTHFE